MESLAGKEAESDAKRMREIYTYIKEAGMEKRIVLDPSITRGLDYYTGLVYETFLDSLPSIGSVCSGGRYDNLAGLYMKDKISGVGASIGLDRLIAALDETGDAQKQKGFLDAEIFCTDESLIAYYQKIARTLRSSNVSAEVFPEAKKMNQQYAAAEKMRSLRYFCRHGAGAKIFLRLKSCDARTVRKPYGTRSSRKDKSSLRNIKSAGLTICIQNRDNKLRKRRVYGASNYNHQNR